MHNTITSIFIDIGDVLFLLDYQGLWNSLCEKSGKTVVEVKNALYAEEIFYPFESGEISAGTYFDEVQTRLSCALSFDEFRDIWNSLLVKNTRMFALASSLKSQAELLVLSNTNELNVEYMKNDINTLTDKVVYSCRVGYLKPDPRIYEYALGIAGVSPDRVLFIDDTLENVEAAEAIGIHAHHFKSEENLSRLLAMLGFAVPVQDLQ